LALSAAAATDREQFEAFKVKFGRSYGAEEEDTRFAAFQGNLKKIQRLNADGGEVFGITKFADLTAAEFKATYLGYKRTEDRSEQTLFNATATAAPASADWRTKGATTPVKDQGQCGSCWAFSTTEQVESNYFLAGNKLTEFSTQQIVACDKTDLGCNGGDTVTAYKYVKKAGGMATAKAYPDTSSDSGKTGKCKTFTPAGGKVTGFTYATPACNSGKCNNQDEDTMASNIAAHAPASICVNAEAWQLYNKGTLTGKKCGGHGADDLDHCVQAVGYSSAGNGKGSGYWIVRNSWNTDWGIKGFIHVEMGTNACGIANEATFATIG
jgi:C1A family cysteine protease